MFPVARGVLLKKLKFEKCSQAHVTMTSLLILVTAAVKLEQNRRNLEQLTQERRILLLINRRVALNLMRNHVKKYSIITIIQKLTCVCWQLQIQT